jgi:molybdopterin-guanine dinucleotide biosynthesis protein A
MPGVGTWAEARRVHEAEALERPSSDAIQARDRPLIPEGLERQEDLAERGLPIERPNTRPNVTRPDAAGPGVAYPPTTGVVLAGGRSTRLGQDKALLRLAGGQTLVGTAVATLHPLVAEVVVVASDGQRLGDLPARIVPDVYPDGGALGGIYSGLLAAQHDHALVVACDMPFLSPALLRHLLALPRDYDVLLPRLAGGLLEPLHAIYSRACLDTIERQLAAKRYRVVGFLDRVRVRYVDEPELRRFDPELRSTGPLEQTE